MKAGHYQPLSSLACRSLFFFIVVFCLSATSFSQTSSNPPFNIDDISQEAIKLGYHPHQVIIKTRTSHLQIQNEHLVFGSASVKLPDSFKVRKLERLSDRVSQPIPALENVYVITFAPGISPPEISSKLKQGDEVIYSHPNYLYRPCLTPDDPLFYRQYSLDSAISNPGERRDINALDAWKLERGNSYVIVGVIDSGVDYNHEDLWDRLWRNSDEVPNNGLDDDNNGFIDDVLGWDFLDNDKDVFDDFGHGTHVSGIIGAATNNDTGMAGVDHNCRLLTARVGTIVGYYDIHAVLGILYAIQNGASILNCSWGGKSPSVLLESIMNYAIQSGVTVICAAGNDNTDRPHYPARYPGVLAIGSTDFHDKRSLFRAPLASNFGHWVDLSAPGSAILSCYPGNLYLAMSGTSMATPHVVGAAALIKAHFPGISSQEIMSRLMGTADPIDHLNEDFPFLLGTGRLNLLRALTESPRSHIKIQSFQTEDYIGNHDLRLEPGEVIDMVVSCKNVWRDSDELSLRLKSSDRFVDVFTDKVSIPAIKRGDEYTNFNDPFTFHLSQIIPKNHYLNFELEVRDSYNQYVHSIPFKIKAFSTSLNQLGWPVLTGGEINSSSILADIDGDGSLEVIIGSDDGTVNVIKSDGTFLSGWPQYTSGTITSVPTVADLDQDGKMEVMVGSYDENVYVWNASGELLPGWPRRAGGHGFPTSLAVGDLDGDGYLEIIDGTWNGKVYAWKRDGESLPTFPVELSSQGINSSPAVADLDGDGMMEVVVACKDKKVYVMDRHGTLQPGWPREAQESFIAAPALGNLDGDADLEIILPSNDGFVYAWHHEGTPVHGWPRETNDSIVSSPAIGDVDQDGRPEIVIGSEDAHLYVYNHDGSMLEGFPVEVKDKIVSSPVIGDVDGNGDLEIVFGAGDSLYALRNNGDFLYDFPMSFQDIIWSTPSLGDLDSDGDIEIVAGCKNHKVYAIDIYSHRFAPPQLPWPMFSGNTAHTGVSEALTGPPQIRMAGSLLLREGVPTETTYVLAYVVDPDRDVEKVTVTFLSGHTEIMYDDGAHDDFGKGDGWFATSVPASVIGPTPQTPIIEAVDMKGRAGDIWPYLTILDWTVRKQGTYQTNTAHETQISRNSQNCIPSITTSKQPRIDVLSLQAPGPAPVVLAAGYGNATLSTISGGPLEMQAFVLKPDGGSVVSVEVYFQDNPTGIFLHKRAEVGNLTLFDLKLNIVPGSLLEGQYLFQLKAIGEDGSLSCLWPNLE